jgi:hemolysin activation/secretion protein
MSTLVEFMFSSILICGAPASAPAWGDLRYVDSDTELRKARTMVSAVTGTLKAHEQVKVDFFRDGWYAVFRSDETVRDEAKAIGYVYASLLWSAELADRPATAPYADASGSQPRPAAGDEAEGGAVESMPNPEQSAAPDTRDVKVNVLSFQFRGNTILNAQELKTITHPYTGRQRTLDQLKAAADAVTAAYKAKGYLLASAYLPPQEVADGIFTIEVVEGRIGKLEVVGNDYLEGDLIRGYFNPVEEKGIISEQSLLDSVLRAKSSLPVEDVNVILEKGETPGTVNVLVKADEKRPFDISFDYDNYGSEMTSRNRIGTTLTGHDPFLGSTLAFRGIMGDDFDSTALGLASWRVPVSALRTDFQVSYLISNYAVGQSLSDLGIEGNTEMWGLSTYHSILAEQEHNLSAFASFQHKDQESDILSMDMSHDTFNVAGLGLTYDGTDQFDGRNLASIGFYQGIPGILNSFDEDDTDISRLGAPPDFQKYTVDLTRLQSLGKSTYLSLKASGQYSPDKLLSMEQVALGGHTSVRGFEPAEYLGDMGYGISAELLFPAPFVAGEEIVGQKISEILQFALFFDHGGAYLHDPEPGEDGERSMNGTGLGVRLFKDWISLKFEVAFPFKGSSLQLDEPIFYISTLFEPIGLYDKIRE